MAPESRDEVRRRIDSLYDHAEIVTGRFNATRAMARGTRARDASPAARPSGRPDPALDAIIRRWLDTARPALGPAVPAALPADRLPTAGFPGRGGPAPAHEPPAPALPAGEPAAAPEAAPATGTAGGLGPGAAGVAGALTAGSAPPAETTRSTPTETLRPTPSEAVRPTPAETLRPTPIVAVRPTPIVAVRPTPDTDHPPASAAGGSPTPPTDRSPAPAASLLPAPATIPRPAAPAPAIDAGTTAYPAVPVPAALPAALPTALPATFPVAFPTALPPALPTDLPAAPTAGPTALAPVSSHAPRAAGAVAFARAQVGKPCVWGAAGPGSYDCAGLTQAAWRAAGVALPRAAHEQALAGTPVAAATMEPGDLVFFFDDDRHVGLHTGDGMMVHAPGPGSAVREEPIQGFGEAVVHRIVRPA